MLPCLFPASANERQTNVTFAGAWERNFVAPLLNNTYFSNGTLLLLTYDEVETYGEQNKMFSILLGGAIPDNLRGTTDNTFYNHYSTISTVSQNWGLPSLGRWDCHANVFEIVANKTGYMNYNVDSSKLFFNSSYPGPLSDDKYIPTWPVPTADQTCANGKGVLGSVVSAYSKMQPTYNYSSPYPFDKNSSNNAVGSYTGDSPENSTTSARPSTGASSTGSVGGSSASATSGTAASGSASGSATASASKSGASAVVSCGTFAIIALTVAMAMVMV